MGADLISSNSDRISQKRMNIFIPNITKTGKVGGIISQSARLVQIIFQGRGYVLFTGDFKSEQICMKRSPPGLDSLSALIRSVHVCSKSNYT